MFEWLNVFRVWFGYVFNYIMTHSSEKQYNNRRIAKKVVMLYICMFLTMIVGLNTPCAVLMC